MTLQKFYEKMIKLSLFEANISYNDKSPLKLICDQIDDIDSASMDEICLHATLAGIQIDKKANFKKYGEDYLIQCLYFLDSLCDVNTLEIMIQCIMKYKTLQSIITSKFKKCCIELYIDNILREHNIAKVLSIYIYNSCKDIEEYDKFKLISKATGLISHNVPVWEF